MINATAHNFFRDECIKVDPTALEHFTTTRLAAAIQSEKPVYTQVSEALTSSVMVLFRIANSSSTCGDLT